MSITEIFQVLGIEETKDESAIKQAYREKLRVTNPEDNPEGFKRLRTAYEEACVYAKSDEDTKEKEEDNTPSGQWIQKIAKVYGKMDTRQDVELWRSFFEEDIFLALEEEENCRMKLLRFLMEHFKLPTDVWKLLDEKLHIVEDAASLRESFPGDFVNYIVNRCNQGEDIEFDRFEGDVDADYDLFLQYSNSCWDALCEEQLEQAADFLRNADDLGIYHPVMELNRAWLWEKQGKADEAEQWLEKLYKRYPEDIMIGYHLAEILWKNEHKERACEVFEEIKEKNKKHYMSNRRLAEWYFEKGRYQDAKDCAEELLGAGTDDDFRELLTKINNELEKDMEKSYKEKPGYEMGLELGWCYLQDGRYSKGVSLALELKDEIPKEKRSEYRGLLSKLYAEGAEYEKAIHMAGLWEEALKETLAGELEQEEREKNEDRLRQSYAIRSYCYRQMGYKDKELFQKSIECIEAVEQKKTPDINMMLEKAYVYMEMEEADKCLEITRMLIEEHQIYAAYAAEQEMYRRMWDAQGVVQSGYNCIHFFPDYLRPYERIAKVYLDLKYTEDLEKILADAKEQNLESVLLEAYQYQMTHEVPDTDELDKKLEEFRKEYLEKVEAGQLEYYEKGLSIVTEYLYCYPGSYLLVERALFHKAACKYDEAIKDFNKALAEEPGNPYALNGLAYVYKMKGDYEQALICTRKAIYYFEEEYARSYSNLGDLYSLLGNYKMALKAYKDVLRVGGERIKENQYYMRRYAALLAKAGYLEGAEKAINGAYGNHLECYCELADIYNSVGEADKSQSTFHQWYKKLNDSQKVVKKSDYAKYYNHLAWHELVFGDCRKAVEYFEKGIKNRTDTDNIAGTYSDLIFACVLCGDDEKGRMYAVQLQKRLQEQKEKEPNAYYELDKMSLVRKYWSLYYTASVEELDAIMNQEAQTSICYFCTNCICKELEGARILHLFRMGREKEAYERLALWQDKQSVDEYLRAIQHQCEAGVRVVPYSVNGRIGCQQEADTVVEQSAKEDSPKGVGAFLKKVLGSVFKG